MHDFEHGGADSPGAVVMLETGNLPDGVEPSDEIARILKPPSSAIILVVCLSAEEAALIEGRLNPRLHPFVQYLWTD